jgi:thymidylate synthase
VHSFSDAHIYIDQIDSVNTMLAREARRLPTLTLNTDKKDIFDIRRQDFTLSDYDPHPGIKKIPVAI